MWIIDCGVNAVWYEINQQIFRWDRILKSGKVFQGGRKTSKSQNYKVMSLCKSYGWIDSAECLWSFGIQRKTYNHLFLRRIPFIHYSSQGNFASKFCFSECPNIMFSELPGCSGSSEFIKAKEDQTAIQTHLFESCWSDSVAILCLRRKLCEQAQLQRV